MTFDQAIYLYGTMFTFGCVAGYLWGALMYKTDL